MDAELNKSRSDVPVGAYRVDIFITENGTDGRNVIIENQYGQTNHDHLGKIITRGSDKRANIVIWVAERFGHVRTGNF